MKNKQRPKKGESNALKRKLRKNLENSKKKIQRKERISDFTLIILKTLPEAFLFFKSRQIFLFEILGKSYINLAENRMKWDVSLVSDEKKKGLKRKSLEIRWRIH